MSSPIERVTIDPDVCNGKPTIRGMRLTVQSVLELLAQGESRQSILENYPFLESEDIDACLLFASQMMQNRYEVAKVA
jgi:uncharacterized protein (DUF433 family)